MNTSKVILLYLINSAIGGGLGYGLAVLFLKRLDAMEKEEYQDPYFLHEEDENNEPVILKSSSDVPQREPMDYTRFKKEKGDLEELANRYKSEDPSPYTIVSSEMHNDGEMETLYFYNDDSVWADENDGIIEDAVSLVGPNAHLHFGEQSGDPDIVFIRNANDNTNYECIRLHKSYAVEVLGEEPVIKKPSLRKKVKKQVIEEDEDRDPS